MVAGCAPPPTRVRSLPAAPPSPRTIGAPPRGRPPTPGSMRGARVRPGADEGVRRRPGCGSADHRAPLHHPPADAGRDPCGKPVAVDGVDPDVRESGSSAGPTDTDALGTGSSIGRADPSADPPAEGPAGGVLFSLHRARTDRVASLGNRRTDPRGPTAAEHGVHSRYRLERTPRRPEYERVRSLRTQQRAESQCQVATPLWVPLVEIDRERPVLGSRPGFKHLRRV